MAKNVWGATGKSRSPTLYAGGKTTKECKIKGKIGLASSENKGKYIYGSDKNPKVKISKEVNKGYFTK